MTGEVGRFSAFLKPKTDTTSKKFVKSRPAQASPDRVLVAREALATSHMEGAVEAQRRLVPTGCWWRGKR